MKAISETFINKFTQDMKTQKESDDLIRLRGSNCQNSTKQNFPIILIYLMIEFEILLTLQEAASGMYPKWQGGAFKAPLLKPV